MELKRKKLYLSIIFLAVFLILAYFVKSGIFFQGIDEQASSFFSEKQSAYGLQVMHFFSFLGSVYFLPALIILISLGLYFRKRKKESLFLFFTFGVGALLGEIIKAAFGRARPENLFESNFSFPSIHSLGAVLAYGGIGFLLWKQQRKTSYGFFALALLIGFSRLYINVHWISDVLGGFVLGLGFLLLGIWMFFDREF